MFWRKREITRSERDFLASLKVYFEAYEFIRSNTFGKYFIISGIFFLIFFNVSIQFLINGLNSFQPLVLEHLSPIIERFVTFSKEQIESGIDTAFWLLDYAIKSNRDTIFAFIFLILGTPFFSFISSKTEEIKTGKIYVFKWRTFFKEIWRGLSISTRNTFKQFLLILLITLVSFIPYCEIITPFFTFLVQAYFNGIIMTDYCLERRGLSVKESEAYYKKNKPQMFAIGLGFMFLLLIPVIGWFVAPTYALVAAYLRYHQKK